MAKLTLSADKKTIERAKKLASEYGTSVSSMFAQYIEQLDVHSVSTDDQVSRKSVKLGPATRRALGLVQLPKGKSYRTLIQQAMSDRYE